MFLILDHTYFATYVDDNTPYIVNENAAEVIRDLQQIFKRLLKWLKIIRWNQILISAIWYWLGKKIEKLMLETLSLKIRK